MIFVFLKTFRSWFCLFFFLACLLSYKRVLTIK